jgi:molybdopterin-guanine dinucleotide biosynthesis protein A
LETLSKQESAKQSLRKQYKMSTPFTAALLAGGKSSRMGQDKATLEWEGQVLWQRQIELLESLNPAQLLISGRPDGPYVGSMYDVIFDMDNNLGPLSGLNSLLLKCKTSRLLVLAVDMPWMTKEILEKLLSFEDGVIPELNGFWEGAAAVYPSDIMPQVRNILQSPDRSLQSLARLALNCGFIDTWPVPDEIAPCFRSWNQPLPT